VVAIGLEATLLKIGSGITKKAFHAWLSRQISAERRSMGLTELVAMHYPLIRQQREFRRRIEEIEENVADRLSTLCEIEFHGLDAGEQQATLDAVADALESADLSDSTLFRVDLNPFGLAQEIRKQVPDSEQRAFLSEPAAALFGVVLDQTCYYLAHLLVELPEFQSRATVETLSRLSALAGHVNKILDRLPVADLELVDGVGQDESFEPRYAELFSIIYDRLEIMGITTAYYEPTVTLTVAYMSLTASTLVAEQEEAWEGEAPKPERRPGSRRMNFHRQYFRVEDALCGKRLVLLEGEAGAGKSTLLQWLGINATRQRFTGRLADWNGRIPFLIKLREFVENVLPTDDQILLHANAPQWGVVPEGWVGRMAQAGRALFLVDGVDEVPERKRSKVRDWLRSLNTRYPDCQVVVTSRPSSSIQSWLVRDKYSPITLEPMRPDDVVVFVNRWHTALIDAANGNEIVLPCRQEEIPQHQRSLLTSLEVRSHLLALASNPLLCAMVCALNLDRRANLPRDRMTLYEAALNMLLERRDAERQVPQDLVIQLSVPQKLALLRSLAWWLNENGRAEMSRDEAALQLQLKMGNMPGVDVPAGDLLNHLLERSGLIRQPVIGRVDFVHRTFQEFLAAKEVVDRDSIDMLVNNADSDLWHETILMACAHARPAQRDRLLDGIINRAYHRESADLRRHFILLAAGCLEMAVEASPYVIARVQTCMKELLPPTNNDEASTLATAGSILLQILPDSLDDVREDHAGMLYRTVALSNEITAMDILSRYARDSRWAVQDEVVNCWQHFDMEQYARRVMAFAPLHDGVIHVTDPEWLPHLTRLRLLKHADVKVHSTDLDDLQVFGGFTSLRRLLLSVGGDCDLTPLRHHPGLIYLHLRANGQFSSLPVLRSFPELRHLVLLADTPFDNLDFVDQLDSLTRLEIEPVARTIDLAVLSIRKNIQQVALRRCEVALDLSPLAAMTSLNRLDLRGCPAEFDLSPLAGRQLTVRLDQGQRIRGREALAGDLRTEFF
jgi:hypothetical protein